MIKDLVKLLANKINQPHVIKVYLKKVYDKGFNDGLKYSRKENSITTGQIEERINELQKKIDKGDFEHWRDENDHQDDIFAMKRMLLILEGYVNK